MDNELNLDRMTWMEQAELTAAAYEAKMKGGKA